MQVNKFLNERFIKPLPGQPPPMWLVRGMVLQGCSHNSVPIVNGVLYEVSGVDLNERGEVSIVWAPAPVLRGQTNQSLGAGRRGCSGSPSQLHMP